MTAMTAMHRAGLILAAAIVASLSPTGPAAAARPASFVPPEITKGRFVPIPGATNVAISGKAVLVRLHGKTVLEVHVAGLKPGHAYPAHLHLALCADKGPHYRNDPDGPGEPPNELWPSSEPKDPRAGLIADGEGRAVGVGVAPWRARPSSQSVRIHAPGDQGSHAHGLADGGHGTPAIACADLG